MKHEIISALGISISVGLSVNKTLSKLCSNFQKPNGFCVFSGRNLAFLLKNTLIDAVWGVGHNTGNLLKKYDIKTAYDFALKKEDFVKSILSKPGIELWHELNGEYIFNLNPNLKESFKSISKIRTFSPPSNNPQFLYAKLVQNLEIVCEKARRYKLKSKRIGIGLKGQDFNMYQEDCVLTHETAIPIDMMPSVEKAFLKVFDKRCLYRAVYVVLYNLIPMGVKQYSLFETEEQYSKKKFLFDSIDRLNNKYSGQVVSLGQGLYLKTIRRPRYFRIPSLQLHV